MLYPEVLLTSYSVSAMWVKWRLTEQTHEMPPVFYAVTGCCPTNS